jgi:hypothetical protein
MISVVTETWASASEIFFALEKRAFLVVFFASLAKHCNAGEADLRDLFHTVRLTLQ